MGILKGRLDKTGFTITALLSTVTPAAAQDLSPITTMINNVATALTGPVGIALGVLALAIVGVSLAMGRLDFVRAGAVFLGLAILYGAAAIQAGF